MRRRPPYWCTLVMMVGYGGLAGSIIRLIFLQGHWAWGSFIALATLVQAIVIRRQNKEFRVQRKRILKSIRLMEGRFQRPILPRPVNGAGNDRLR